jgi:hypothetical protein
MACCAAVAMRIGGTLPNVTAVGALALYAGSRLGPWFGWIPALAVMAGTDWFLHQSRAYDPSYPTYACYVLDVLLGWLMIRKTTATRVGGTALLSALLFYLITNFFVWYHVAHSSSLEPVYPNSIAGLLACYAAGLPFFRYTLLGNLGFCTAIFGADALLARTAAPAPVPSETR